MEIGMLLIIWGRCQKLSPMSAHMYEILAHKSTLFNLEKYISRCLVGGGYCSLGFWQTYKSRNKPQWSYEQVICQIWNTKIYSKVFSCLNDTQIEKLDFRQFFHLMLKSFMVFKPSACSYLLPDSFLWLSWCRLEFLLLQSQMICYWFCFEPEVMIRCWQRL